MLRHVKDMNEAMSFSVVIYESTVRLEKIIGEMLDIFGEDVRMCLAVDLTKVSEKIFRGSVVEILEIVKNTKLKGEVTIVVSLVE